MEDTSQVQQITRMRQSFFNEEIIDENFFQLEYFTTDDNLNYVEDKLDEYFEETNELLAIIEEQLAKNPVDLSAMDKTLHKLKGSSASVGANKVRIEASAALDCCHCGIVEGVKAGIERAKMELANLKTRLDPYWKLVKQTKNPNREEGN